MRRLKIFRILLVFILFILPKHGFSEEKEKIETLKQSITWSTVISNGLNYLDLDGDGEKDIIVKGYRNNISAHTFSVISFYLSRKIDSQEKSNIKRLDIISIGQLPDKEEYQLFTHEGADCILRDFRLVKIKNSKKVYLIKAERYLSGEKTYADKDTVKFTIYELQYDDTDDRFSFNKINEFRATRKYCDVNEAFKQELGI
ncbi:MAG TPA: hypothetical protein DEA57_02755 [Sulfurihydrogenibium sp.]|uniref:carbapenem self-resistance protein CarG family protein n=1 Tax=Sulfurihydrogenibium sp. (strain YO3AOP1) TaxID=436114 RepID=UPI0001723270|nr:hypothetical protein [Sulfurihydrogenibium sp. YO3AOP1]ACD66527.1 hypothetical protein SYO3AOP1_0899 [Sulfurihydrogenibium sp. YO3AOP1]HBT98386.1 hypothetical protein [Sulfurihydrogenibium sp.]